MATWPIMSYAMQRYGTISVRANGIVEVLAYGSSSTLAPGWSADAIGGAVVGSLADVLAACLLTHTQITAVSATYVIDAYVRPVYRIVVTVTGGASVDITAVSVGALGCGLLAGDTFAVAAGQATVQNSVRVSGCWSPNAMAVQDEPILSMPGSGTISPYDASAHDRVRAGRSMLRTVTWPLVEAADVSAEIALQSTGYLSLASRVTSDYLGTLDELLAAASRGVTLGLVRGYGDETGCVLAGGDAIQRDAYTTLEAHGGRRYRVTLPLVEAAEYTTVY